MLYLIIMCRWKVTVYCALKFRKGQLLNIHQEMTSEKVMYEALQATLNENYPSAGLVDYTCTESVILEGQNVKKDIKEGGETIAPFYVIFVEFSIQSDVTGMEVAHFEEKVSSFPSSLKRNRKNRTTLFKTDLRDTKVVLSMTYEQVSELGFAYLRSEYGCCKRWSYEMIICCMKPMESKLSAREMPGNNKLSHSQNLNIYHKIQMHEDVAQSGKESEWYDRFN